MSSGLRVGDVVSRPKVVGVIDHYGIVVGFDRILHSTPERGEHVSSFAEFAFGQPVRLVSRTTSWAEAIEIVQRAGAILSKPATWSLINNCEVTVAKAQGLPPHSKQLGWAGVGAAVGLALLAVRA
jgi:hypothetical protein